MDFGKFYKLGGKDGREVIPCSLHDWSEWFEKANRRVASDSYYDQGWHAYDQTGTLDDPMRGIDVSTVCLGIDYRIIDDPEGSKPLVFETMIFGGEFSEYTWRASTWEEAERNHAFAKMMVEHKMSEVADGK